MNLALLTTKTAESDSLDAALEFDLGKSELTRKKKLLHLFDILSVTIIGFYIVILVATILLTGHSLGGSASLIACIAGLIVCAASYRLAESGHYSWGCWIWIGSWFSLALINYAILGTASPMLLWLLMLIVLTLVLMTVRDTIIVTTISVVFSLGLYLIQNVLHIYTPLDSSYELAKPGDSIISNIVAVIIILLLLILPAREQTKVMHKWNNRLHGALAELSARQNSSQQVSQQVLELAAELNSVASQQASGSREQVTVVTQVNSSVSELTNTAGNIAELAKAISEAAAGVLEESRSIQDTTTQAAVQSGQGLNAVEQSAQASREVAQLYQNLLTIMHEQSQKSTRMRHILELLNSIASETHLLSLNAAIESAGVGMLGDRFGVIAHEVKNLANRSAAASKEVVEIVQEIAQGTQLVVKAAENGYTKANQLTEVVQQTGHVIKEMQQVASHSQSQATLITDAVSDVRDLGVLIVAATAQQRSASEQVMSALTGLSTVAQQGVEGSNLVTSTALNLKMVSEDLNTVLSN